MTEAIDIIPFPESIEQQIMNKSLYNKSKSIRQQSQQLMFAEDGIENPEMLAERQKKNRQIMKMIYSYKRTPEDLKNLQRIKNQTRMEINLRYMNCSRNRNYKFPKLCQSQQQLQEQQSPFKPKVVKNSQLSQSIIGEFQYITFDLYAQAEVIPRYVSTKVLELDQKMRRVKSLQKQQLQGNSLRKQKRRPVLIKQDNKKHVQSFRNLKANLIIQNSVKHRIVEHSRHRNYTQPKNNETTIKLPELSSIHKTVEAKKKKKFNLEEVIGRKIVTETSPDRYNEGCEQGKRLAKYMKNFQGQAKSIKSYNQSKKFFLKQY